MEVGGALGQEGAAALPVVFAVKAAQHQGCHRIGAFGRIGIVLESLQRLFGRMHLLPGGMYASEIEVETFVAHRPFTREEMGVLESQVTTRIHWQGRNLDINLDCLHGLVEFPETQTQGRVLGGFGTVDRPLQMTGKTVFPPTPMPKWKKYLFDQRHERVGEEWRLTNYWVNPPRGARHILGAAV